MPKEKYFYFLFFFIIFGNGLKNILLDISKFQNNSDIITFFLLNFNYTANFFNASFAASCSASFFDCPIPIP